MKDSRPEAARRGAMSEKMLSKTIAALCLTNNKRILKLDSGNRIRSGKWAFELIEGKPLVKHLADQVAQSKIKDFYIYTSQESCDTKIVKESAQWGIKCIACQGNKDPWLWDWVSKMISTAGKADYIFFLPSIIFLFDFGLIEQVVESQIRENTDNISLDNLLFVNGSIWKAETLKTLFQEYPISIDRPGWTKIARDKRIKVGSAIVDAELTEMSGYLRKIGYQPLLPNKRNIEIIRRIYQHLYQNEKPIRIKDVFQLLKANPAWASCLPTHMEVEVTNDCREGCPIYPWRIMERKVGYIEFDLFKRIVDQLADYGLELNLPMLGEPLLHPSLMEMIAYAKSQGIEVSLYTNGLHLTEEMSRALIEAELDYLIFNLITGTAKTYQEITGSEEYEKVTNNIEDFVNQRERIKIEEGIGGELREPIVGVQIIKMDATNNEIEVFMDKWDSVAKIDDKEERAQDQLRSMIYESTDLPVEYAIIQGFNDFAGQIEDRSIGNCTPFSRFPCRQLRDGLSILWNGDVVSCRQDFNGRRVLGNLEEKSLLEIWDSQERKNLWQEHIKGNHEHLLLCNRCKEWYYNLYA